MWDNFARKLCMCMCWWERREGGERWRWAIMLLLDKYMWVYKCTFSTENLFFFFLFLYLSIFFSIILSFSSSRLSLYLSHLEVCFKSANLDEVQSAELTGPQRSPRCILCYHGYHLSYHGYHGQCVGCVLKWFRWPFNGAILWILFGSYVLFAKI